MTPTLPLEVGSARSAVDGAVGVAHELVVGDATGLAGGGRGVVGVDIEALACVEVGADRVVAVGGEAPRDLLGRRVPPGQVVDDEDPAEGAVAGRERLVGVDRRALVAGERHVLGREASSGAGTAASFSCVLPVHACGAAACAAHYGAPRVPAAP